MTTIDKYLKLKEYIKSMEIRRLSEYRDKVIRLYTIAKDILNDLSEKHGVVIIKCWEDNYGDKKGKYLVIDDNEVFNGLIALNNLYHLLIVNSSRKYIKEQFNKAKRAVLKLIDILIKDERES